MTASGSPLASGEPSALSASSMEAVDRAESKNALERFASPSTNAVVLAIMLAVGLRIGMAPLQDNSFLTHLSTGRIILDDWSVPDADPYSWTAHGTSWTVQSWLASAVYAGLEEVVGLVGVRMLSTALVLAVIVGLWKLTEPADGLLARGIAIALPVTVGVTMWVERPYMFGVLGLVFVLLAAEDRMDPRWLVPIMWFWANTHGSFPFGAGLLGLLAMGQFIDSRHKPVVELRCLLWTVVGILLSMVGPLGTKLLTFPFEAIEHREAFAEVKEWQRLDLNSTVGRLFLAQIVVTAVALARVRRWRAVLPALVFAIAAVTSARNVVQASIVVTPITALGLAGIGSIKGSARTRLARPIVHALTIVIVVGGLLQVRQADTALEAYPEEAAIWMRTNGLMDTSSRVLSRELVGNYLEYAYGPDEVRIFVDDRVDMFPAALIETYVGFLKNEDDHTSALEELDPTAILWEGDSKLGRWIETSPTWEVVWEDETWIVAVPS